MVMDWDVYDEKVLLRTPVMTINSGPVVCKRSGRKKEFYRFDFPDWVNIVALTPRRELVMIRQFRYGTGKVEIEIPGGMVNPDEDPITAGCRELLEETGYQGRSSRIIGRVCPNPALQRNTCFTVLVEEVERIAPPALDDMEDIDCFLASDVEVRQLMATGELDHGLVLNALMFYQRHVSPA